MTENPRPRIRIEAVVERRDWHWLWLRRKENRVEIYRGPVEQWPTPEVVRQEFQAPDHNGVERGERRFKP